MSECKNESCTLNELIEEQKYIDSLIAEAHHKALDKQAPEQEQRIKLLQRKKHKLRYEIEYMCTHEWGDSNYGYIECNTCGKQRNTRHW